MIVPGLLAGLLVARRIWEFLSITRALRALRRRRIEIDRQPALDLWPNIVVLLPLYREQLVVEQLLDHFSRLRYPADRLKIYVITTAKEDRDEGRKTAELLPALLARHPGRFEHYHHREPHKFRADQMNPVVRQLLAAMPHRQTYVGVYNADSLPDLDTLEVLAMDACHEREQEGEFPPAYQQTIRYFVPARYRSAAAHSTAAFQAFYTNGHFLPRIQRSRPGRGVPISFAGHGEFVRLDALERVGMFPNYAYADGLLLGWEVAFAGYRVRALPCFDHCEVPADFRTLLQQHKAWFLGLFNIVELVRHRFGGGISAVTEGWLRSFFVRRQLATWSWGLRSAYLAALFGWAALLGPGPAVGVGFAIYFYAAAPVLFLALFAPQANTEEPGRRGADWRQMPARLAMSLPALLLDGIGFWPALWMKWKARGGAAPMPPKTDR